MVEFFGNANERDDKTTEQEHYSWNPLLYGTSLLIIENTIGFQVPSIVDVYGLTANIPAHIK